MQGEIYVFEGFLLDEAERRLQKDGIDIQLPPRIFDVLRIMVARHGTLVSYEELMDAVWGETFVEEGNLRYSIHTLRKVLGSGVIDTVPKKGYRFTADVKVIDREEFIARYVGGTSAPAPSAVYSVKTKNDDRTEAFAMRSPVGSGILSRTVVFFAAVTLVLVAVLFGLDSFYIRSGEQDDKTRAIESGQLRFEPLTLSSRALYVGLSRDGKNAAYVIHTAENKYSLILHHIPTKSETVIVAPQEMHLYNVQFSPDGDHIYYGGAEGINRPGVYRIPVYGSSGELITRDPVHHFSISPDGRQIAFYRRVPEEAAHYLDVCLASDGGNCRTVAKRGNGGGFKIWGTAPAWSPDGKKFAAAAFSQSNSKESTTDELIEIDVLTGDQAKLASPGWWYRVHQPYWTSDGKSLHVLVRERVGDPVQIWSLDPRSGGARPVTNDSNDYHDFRPASDESFFLATVWSKSENLFLVPVDDPDNIRQLTFDSDGNNGAWGLKWTADSSGILFSKANGKLTGNLWKLDLAGLQQRQLTFDESSRPGAIDVTQDGRSVVFDSNRSGTVQVWQLDLSGSNLRQLTDGGSRSTPEISPDGKWLYFLGDGLWRTPVEGGPVEKVMQQTPGITRISPIDSSKFIAYYHDNDEKKDSPWKLALFSEKALGEFVQLKIPAIAYEWKHDGSGVYFVDNGETFSNIWFSPLDNSVTTQLTKFTDQKISNFSLSPDGKIFAVSRGSAIGNILKISVQ